MTVSGKSPELDALLLDGIENLGSLSDARLDHLRWMLNQLPDLHVAAESLHYEAKYTGDRLRHDLVERMTPRSRFANRWLVDWKVSWSFLKGMTEDISAAHLGILSTLPKQAPRGGARIRKSGS